MSNSATPAGAGILAPPRPAVDVVVPFAGTAAELAATCRRLASLRLRRGDTLTVVDNTAAGARGVPDVPGLRLLVASGRRTPGYARNRGAQRGSSEWLVFIDADAVPHPDLLDRYFHPQPGPRTALLGGGVIDERVPPGGPLASRYAYLRGLMCQERTFAFGQWGYPKSANIACRRSAFQAVGGFREEIRAAEDADLCYRLRAVGWRVERRERASVVHLSRQTLRGLIVQQLRWGAGGAWLERAYPGSVGPLRGPRLARWALAGTARALLDGRRGGDRAIYGALRPLEALAWELGRLLPNESRAGRR